MSVETARRLLEGGLVSRADVELALLQALIRGVPFVQAFVAQRLELAELLEQELTRAGAPMLRSVQAHPELSASVPMGMCERLLAVPVRRQVITQTVDVAAVDPFDSHIAQEFSYHLDAPVRILRAPVNAIMAALEGLHMGGEFQRGVSEMLGVGEERTPTHGSSVNQSADSSYESVPPGSLSEPPIPLVRRSSQGPRLQGNTAPGVGSSEPPPALGQDERGEPIIGLRRSKPEGHDAVTRARLLEADLAQVERQLAASQSPDEVLELLTEQACPEGCCLVFSVKAGQFVARSANFDVNGLREVTVSRARPSVFEAALESGHYLGKLPETLVHTLIRELFAERLGSEVYVVPTPVGGRPTLMIMVTGFERSFTATRRVDRLSSAASAALERLVLERIRARE